MFERLFRRRPWSLVDPDWDLEIVEFAMEMEETFEISIPDEQAERIRTIGDLKTYLTANCWSQPASSCATQAAFCRLRSRACSVLGVSKTAVVPRTRWLVLLPPDDTFRLWSQIAREAGVPPPTVRDPRRGRDGLPLNRTTVGEVAKLLAALAPRVDDISARIDRLVMNFFDVTDFTDEVGWCG